MSAPIRVVYNACHGGFNLSEQAKAWLRDRGATEKQVDWWRFYNRHHPLLVECVMTLGKAASRPRTAKLEVYELRHGSKYVIEQSDGFEAVMEPADYDWSDALVVDSD